MNTTYYIYKNDSSIVTKGELKKGFIRFPEEIRWDYCNSSEEYIYQGIECGALIEIKKDNVFASDKILTPSQYARFTNIDSISDNTSVEEFDIAVADRYCKWNYPLSEYNLVKENCLDPNTLKGTRVVVVKFKDGTYRLVEV